MVGDQGHRSGQPQGDACRVALMRWLGHWGLGVLLQGRAEGQQKRVSIRHSAIAQPLVSP